MKRILTSFALGILIVGGCASSGDEQPETVIGTPPSPKEDPFFFVAMPAEAVPASPTGTIGEGDGTGEDPAPEAETSTPAETAGDETASPSRATPPDVATPSSRVRCFSCVRICPENVSDADCDESYDTVCGWGRSSERGVASEIANAECEAALDLVRGGSRYSEVSGRCPVSTCR